MNLINLKKNLPVFISFILTVVLIVAVYFQLNELQMSMFINSDTLYLPALFRDLFVDKAKDIQWYLPAATCFFPDLMLFFSVHFFTSNFITAMFFTGMLMNILLILAFYLLLRESIKNISPLYLSIGINLLLLFHFATLYTGDYSLTFYLTIINYHIGAYIGSLFCLYFAMRYLNTNNLMNLGIMVLLYILTFSSDFLTLFHLTIPLLSLCILFFKRTHRTQAFSILIANIAGFGLGFFVYHLLLKSSSIKMLKISYLTFNFNKVAESYSLMFKHQFLFLKAMDIRSVIALICIISFITTSIILFTKLVKYFKSQEIEKSEFLEFTYLLFVVVQAIAIYNGPPLNGVYLDYSILRYNIYVFFLLVLNSGYLLYKLSLIKKLTKKVYVFSVLITIMISLMGLRAMIITNFREGSKQLFGYYPRYVKNLDEMCFRHNLKYGLSAYWEALYLNMMSKKDVRVYQAYGDLNPYPHITNLNWYFGTIDGKTPAPVFKFFIPDNLVDSLVYKRFEGHILDTLKEGETTIVRTDPFTINRYTLNLNFLTDKKNKKL